ncbi:hypothetical protein KDA11_03875, partial [Candidatus Saccharibacteria bacterium]|nr:hypothetical protein [Candidatus Saccharibacteria bacterium]
ITRNCICNIYDEQYVRSYPKDARTLFVKAQMKMGKTKQLRKYISENYRSDASIVIVSFRRTFSNSIQNDFKEFELYNNIGGHGISLRRHKRLIIQVESLHRIDLTDLPPIDLVVMDESESVINQFNSGNFRDTLDASFGCFHAMLVRANTAVCVDANLGQRTYRVIKLLRPQHPIHFEWNKYEVNRDTQFQLTSELGAWLGTLKDRLEAKMRIVIATNSIKTSLGLEKWIKKRFPDREIMNYNSKTLESIKRKHFTDVNKYWKQYDILIYTPTISAGVSFTEKHFDCVFGAFIDMSCDVETCHQMLGRVRDVSSGKYYIYLDGNGAALPTDTRAIERAIVYERDMIAMAQGELHFELDIDLHPSYFKSKYYYVWLENTRIANLSRNRFVSRFVAMTFLSGRIVKILVRNQINDNNICREEFKLSKKVIEFEEHKRIADAPEVSQETYMQLRSKQNLMHDVSLEEYAQIDKYLLCRTYCWSGKEMDPAWVKNYFDAKVRHQYINLCAILCEETIDKAIQKMQVREQIDHEINWSHDYEAKDINTRYVSQKHIIVLGILELLGFTRQFTVCGELPKKQVMSNISNHLHSGKKPNLERVLPIWTTIFDVKYIKVIKQDETKVAYDTMRKIVALFYGLTLVEKDQYIIPRLSQKFVYKPENSDAAKKPLVSVHPSLWLC